MAPARMAAGLYLPRRLHPANRRRDRPDPLRRCQAHRPGHPPGTPARLSARSDSTVAASHLSAAVARPPRARAVRLASSEQLVQLEIAMPPRKTGPKSRKKSAKNKPGANTTNGLPAGERMRPPPSGVTVRMYRTGLGDCFLLA